MLRIVFQSKLKVFGWKMKHFQIKKYLFINEDTRVRIVVMLKIFFQNDLRNTWRKDNFVTYPQYEKYIILYDNIMN